MTAAVDSCVYKTYSSCLLRGNSVAYLRTEGAMCVEKQNNHLSLIRSVSINNFLQLEGG